MSENESKCKIYDPDSGFRRFKLLEFPISFVGLRSSQELDVELDITGSSYIKTMCEGTLMIFDEAREISPSHRAYTIKLLNCHTIEVTFIPNNESIAKLNMGKPESTSNRFVCDLRIINVDGIACCNDETHAEVGRYYLSGQYEYSTITHSPRIVDFGDVAMKTKVIRSIRIRNESKLIAAKITYNKSPGFDVIPRKFCIPANTSIKIDISLNPNNLKVSKTIEFHLRNPHDIINESERSGVVLPDTNFLSYTVDVRANIFISNKKMPPVVESLHKLLELHPWDTYLDKELEEHIGRKKIGKQNFDLSKSISKKKVDKKTFCSMKPVCYSDISVPTNELKTGRLFCKEFRPKITAPDLFKISFSPQKVNFGLVALKTYGETCITIKNSSKYDVTIKFLDNKNIIYTNRKLREYVAKLPSRSVITITLICYGYTIGIVEESFKYTIDYKFYREYAYKIHILSPVLNVQERVLKFGMATSEGFVSDVPVKIYNDFNVPVKFEWDEFNPDVPFEILPRFGTVPSHGCVICDVIYTVTAISKSKVYGIELTSKGLKPEKIIFEAQVTTRKLTVRFLQQFLHFKDIPLNIETVETIRFENGSRESVTFCVLDPLVPGIKITPMSGTMRPKSIVTLQAIVKISCVLDFTFDLFIRVNNKENIGLPLSGNVAEPKLNISPKNVFMPRIPCGMITYVPINIQNSGMALNTVEVLEVHDENPCLCGNMFDVYTQEGNEKKKAKYLTIYPGQTKTLYVKVFDIFRREYDLYIPLKINGLIGPPIVEIPSATEFSYYIGEYEKLYDHNIKVRVRAIHKDISFFRIIGVFTVPWIEFSLDNIEIDYVPNDENSIEFTMTNISKYYFHVCIVTSKLSPHFTLDMTAEDHNSIITDSFMKFELDRGKMVQFHLLFHPHGIGRFVAVASIYLDKAMSIPFSNMTFIGNRVFPLLRADTFRITFPPAGVGTVLSKNTTIILEQASELNLFTCSSKEDPNLKVEFVNGTLLEVGNEIHTLITVKITVSCTRSYARILSLMFQHECGSQCCIEVSFCFTHCPLTLHASRMVSADENPFPYYPLSTQTKLYEYFEKTLAFVERWVYQQGFRRELFPVLPDTFHALALNMVQASVKLKGVSLSLLNFLRRIAGPLMKHIHKATVHIDEPYKTVVEMHDTYKSVINLLRSRGANLWLLQAKFLLTHSQFIIYSKRIPPKYYADIEFTEVLRNDVELYGRLTKQCWLDFILQCFKVFVMDSCFFDCVCVSSEPRDIENVLVTWYNEQIRIAHHAILKNLPLKQINNLTTGLQDGVAIISAIYNHCIFLEDILSFICPIDENTPLNGIVHNACLIIEAMNLLRLSFPLTTADLLEPTFIQMLFLSIHLYVALPMFQLKDKVLLSPPLLRTSSRLLYINPVSQESVIFNFVILNNYKNCFTVEKIPNEEETKKTCINVKYKASFVLPQKAILLAYGFNKTRIFDTYLAFHLIGNVGTLFPFRKYKLTAPIYRPSKVDFSIRSPFANDDVYKVLITETEPTIPMVFEEQSKKKFRFKRLLLMEDEIFLSGSPDIEGFGDGFEHKINFMLYCLNTQSENSWVWFRSEEGEFFVKVVTQPRWDLAVLETLLVTVRNWPLDPCSCGEACECYRTAVLTIPHRNELMLKALRSAMVEVTTATMMEVFDSLVGSTTGQIILKMLLAEGGTKMSEVNHILTPECRYRVTSRNLQPRVDTVTLNHHTDAILALPVTIPPNDKNLKFSLMLVSEDGMDVRIYRIFVNEEIISKASTSSTIS